MIEATVLKKYSIVYTFLGLLLLTWSIQTPFQLHAKIQIMKHSSFWSKQSHAFQSHHLQFGKTYWSICFSCSPKNCRKTVLALSNIKSASTEACGRFQKGICSSIFVQSIFFQSALSNRKTENVSMNACMKKDWNEPSVAIKHGHDALLEWGNKLTIFRKNEEKNEDTQAITVTKQTMKTKGNTTPTIILWINNICFFHFPLQFIMSLFLTWRLHVLCQHSAIRPQQKTS